MSAVQQYVEFSLPLSRVHPYHIFLHEFDVLLEIIGFCFSTPNFHFADGALLSGTVALRIILTLNLLASFNFLNCIFGQFCLPFGDDQCVCVFSHTYLHKSL